MNTTDLYNGKVICITDNDSCFVETGKVYEIRDGLLYDDPDSDEPYNKHKPVMTIDELNGFAVPQFAKHEATT